MAHFPLRRGLTAACCGLVVWFSLAMSAAAAVQESVIKVLQVEHSPRTPRSGQVVTILVTVPAPVSEPMLEYQVVEPGKYVALADPAFKSSWKSISMEKADEGGRFSAKVPAVGHRHLVRYRFQVKNGERTIQFPAATNAEPNFAYFVYDGTPPWRAAINPRGNPSQKKVMEFPPEVMDQVQNYVLIAKERDVENATWYEREMDKEYRYTGTLVANGRVYDHIRFRARGGEWRYAMGKNMWKFDFHKSNRLQAHDDYGRPYKATWGKLNLRACIQQGDYGRRGEQGMYEAVGFRMFNLAGVEAPRTHWISLRIVDGAEENPSDQYRGDYWGLYLAIENEDGRFLDEHDLPDGNIFKMKWWQPEVAHQAKGQPADLSDIQPFVQRLRLRRPEPQWWSQNVDLQRYYSYRSILEAIHHYDLDAGKNYTFYFNPKSAKWQVIPWDIDLTWGDHMFGGGGEPFKVPVLSQPAFRIEYENRQREIRDLLFNPDEMGRLIDECAAIISKGKGLSIVDADRAKWDYHPIMMSRHANPSKAGHGLFYQESATGDFAGMVAQMKDYVKRRSAWIDRSLLRDKNIPEKPTITIRPGSPEKGATVRTTPFAGFGQFAAQKWRVAAVDVKPDLSKKPTQPGNYEITPTWESAESTAFQPEISVPSDALKAGVTYRARVKLKDSAGKWSHWSDPVEFMVGKK